MAHHTESAPDVPSSVLDFCYSDVLDDTKLRPSLVKIPSAQKQLLNRHESWASFLSRRSPNGFVNVPPEILDQIKASHKRQKRAKGSDRTARSTSHAGDKIPVPQPSGSQPSCPRRVDRDGEHGSDDDSDNNSKLSWSLSPDPHLRPPGAESEAPNEPFITQLSDQSPPQPTIMTSTDSIQPPDLPQSSQGPEDELEVEVPAALTHNPIPINKSALPMLATPPSAQIPCTFEQSTETTSTGESTNPDLQQKAPRQTIYKAMPQLYHPPKQDLTSVGLKTNVNAFRPVADYKESVVVESSSADNTSSSVVPSYDQGLKGKGILTHDTALNPQEHRSPVPYRSSSPIRMARSPSQPAPSPQPAALTTRDISAPIQVSKGGGNQFIRYTATYPSYRGTLQDFLTACTYIYGQRRRIRTSLYDDFIRTWVEGYLPYVEQCDVEYPHRKALEAIEWYNEIDDDPLFTSRVVTRLNLQSILESHLGKTEVNRMSEGKSSSQTRSEGLSFQSRAAQNAQKNKILKHPTRRQQPKGKAPAREPVEVPRMSSIVNSPKLFRSANPYMSACDSPGEIETQQAYPTMLTRAVSETASRKRPAIDDLHSERTKRISRNPTPDNHHNIWSEPSGAMVNYPGRSGSIDRGSVVPESTVRGKSVETTTDQEKRRQRLAKHFKKRMAGK